MLSYGSTIEGPLDTDEAFHPAYATNHPSLALLSEFRESEDFHRPCTTNLPSLALPYKIQGIAIWSVKTECSNAHAYLHTSTSSIDLFTQLSTHCGNTMTSLREDKRKVEVSKRWGE